MLSERRDVLFSMLGAVLTVCLLAMAPDGGEDCRSIHSCGVSLDGPTVTVTGQNGRHRSLVKQQAGIDQMPVYVMHRTGEGQPCEIVGVQGKVLPNSYPPAASVESRPQQDGSLVGRIKQAFMPSAQAAEATEGENPYAQFVQKPEETNPYAQFGEQPKQQPDNMALSPTERLKNALVARVLGDYATALRLLQPLAKEGNVAAQFSLGQLYDLGHGVPQDHAEAAKWYRLAAEQGDKDAQFNLGVMYEQGQGVPQNSAEAAKWYRLAAAQGNAGAQLNLGMMYEWGTGVRQNYAEASKWYRLAAAQGNAGAQISLGGMYAEGEGVPQNYAEAAKWYRLAAAKGNAWAQLKLGWMYGEGHGVPQNYAEAAKWYRLAAEQGDVDAQSILGSMYERGTGVLQDYTEAVKWYLLAAAEGNVWAQVNLGVMYEEGRGVTQDYVQAHMWSNISAANAKDPEIRDAAVRNRDRVTKRMTSIQIARAQQLAREWKPSFFGQQAAASQPSLPNPPTAQIVSGSGFFVSGDGDVLTNAHVIEGCRTAGVAGQGTTTTAQIIARDRGIDLALLKVAQRSPATAQLRLTVQQGESVFAYGFPLAGLLSSGGNFTAGSVTALAGIQDDSRSLQISAPVQPGSSGGPLLDEAGNVVGVVVAKLDALKVARVTDDLPQNVNFAIKATVAADFLGAHGVRHTEGKVGASLPPSTIAERARAFTVRIECEQSATGDPPTFTRDLPGARP